MSEYLPGQQPGTRQRTQEGRGALLAETQDPRRLRRGQAALLREELCVGLGDGRFLTLGRVTPAGAAVETSPAAREALTQVTAHMGNGAIHFSTQNAYAAAKALLLGSATVTVTPDDAAMTLTLASTAGPEDTDDLPEGSVHLYFTEGRAQEAAEALTSENGIINGDGRYFQRQDPNAATSRTDTQFGADRWRVLTESNPVTTQRIAGFGSHAPYAMRLTQANTSPQRMGTSQMLWSYAALPFRGKVARLQALLRCSAMATIKFALVEYTGTMDAAPADVVGTWSSPYLPTFISSGTVIASGSVDLMADTPQAITCHGDVSTAANNLYVLCWTDAPVAQNTTLDLTEVGLYQGDIPRVWTARMNELWYVQRHFEKTAPVDVAPGGSGDYAWNATLVNATHASSYAIPFKVTKFKTPTVTVYSEQNAAVGKGSEYAYNVGYYFTADRNITVFRSTNMFHWSVTSGTSGCSLRFYWTAEFE